MDYNPSDSYYQSSSLVETPMEEPTPQASDPITDTKRAIDSTARAMSDILVLYGIVSNVPFPHEYWSLQNKLANLTLQLKFLRGV